MKAPLCTRTNNDCGKRAITLWVIDGKVIPVCKTCLLSEWEYWCDEWEEKNGSFCMECGENITQELLRDESLDCYCEAHRK